MGRWFGFGVVVSSFYIFIVMRADYLEKKYTRASIRVKDALCA